MKSTWEFVIQFFIQFCNFSVGLKYFRIRSKKFRIKTSYYHIQFTDLENWRAEMGRDLPEVTQLINARAGTELSPSPLDQLFSKWFPKWLLPGVSFVLSSPLWIRSSRHVPAGKPLGSAPCSLSPTASGQRTPLGSRASPSSIRSCRSRCSSWGLSEVLQADSR